MPNIVFIINFGVKGRTPASGQKLPKKICERRGGPVMLLKDSFEDQLHIDSLSLIFASNINEFPLA
jgi:hypothetical protein